MEEFELWLDESGDFKNEAKKRDRGKRPSLVGGILFPKKQLHQLSIRELIDSSLNHATELSGSQKVEYILPTLERLKGYGAIEVFFENAAYEDCDTNRQLYLKIIAEGLLQLTQRLNSQYEDVCIHVLIARRQDRDSTDHAIIQRSEYISALRACITKKISEHKAMFSSSTAFDFQIEIANQTDKLILADFACNTRLTRSSEAFREVRSRVDALYEDALVFTMSEVTSESFIKVSLTEGNIADAVIELFTTRDSLDIGKITNLIIAKMKTMSHRLVKAQLHQLESSIASLIFGESDYEAGERLLIRLNNLFVNRVIKNLFDAYRLSFTVLLLLSDMYLREGDIVNAKNALAMCEKAQKKTEESLESLFRYYQLQEKSALYEIDSFQYRKAWKRMQKCSKLFETILGAVSDNGGINGRYLKIRSEYYGDSLCMRIYAGMFLQSKEPVMYKKLCKLSDQALEQYPDTKGELERHRQYRSRIEAEAGNYSEAASWLMQAKMYQRPDLTEDNLIRFLNQICDSEEEISRRYYLMYYVIIMCLAQEHESEIADLLFCSLERQKRMRDEFFALFRERQQQEDISRELEKVKEYKTDILYHPVEIICWKYGKILCKRGKIKEGSFLLRKAVESSFRFDGYITMRVTGLCIASEAIVTAREFNLVFLEEKMKKEIQQQLEVGFSGEYDPETTEFISSLMNSVKKEEYRQASTYVTY